MNWIIGDIHGMSEALDKLLVEIRIKDKNPTLYCVGDLCDRGPDTKSVIDTVIREGIQCVRGNHDDVFDCILSGGPTECSDDQTHDAPMSSLAWFLQFGMYQTFDSYGQNHEDVLGALRGGHYALAAFVDGCVSDEHRRFINNLPLMIEKDDFFIAHASVVPEMELKDALTDIIYKKAMLWGRYDKDRKQINQDKVWGKVGYFGHTPIKHYGEVNAIFGNNIVLLDTGAVFGNGLTAVCHETKEVIKIDTVRPGMA